MNNEQKHLLTYAEILNLTGVNESITHVARIADAEHSAMLNAGYHLDPPVSRELRTQIAEQITVNCLFCSVKTTTCQDPELCPEQYKVADQILTLISTYYVPIEKYDALVQAGAELTDENIRVQTENEHHKEEVDD